MTGFSRIQRSAALTLAIFASLVMSAVGQPPAESPSTLGKYLITGTVYDTTTLKPVSFVTVQVMGTARTALTNETGQYRLIVTEDSVELKFSHVAYYSGKIVVTSSGTPKIRDLYLHPNVIEIPGIRVYGRQYEPGEEIIIEAIRRKKEILAKYKQFSCDAYSKLILRDAKEPDSMNILLITESQVSCFWEAPDKYKEIIKSRRQSANIEADDNMIGVGRILNFNENRIGSVVSPTADDALKYYRYFLLDTIEVDSQRVFVLEIEPKNEIDLLFVGTIQIVDSSYDVVAVDVRFSKGLRQSMIKRLEFSQQCARFPGGLWMPVDVRYNAEISLGIPIPGAPSLMTVNLISSLHSYSFAKLDGSKLFDEFETEVSPTADVKDSSLWQSSQVIPLTADEINGYRRIDSIEHAPQPIYKKVPSFVLGTAMTGLLKPTLFHFNRVEGAYVGFGGTKKNAFPRFDISTRSGYAIDAKFWEHAYGVKYNFPGRARMEAGIEWHDLVRSRPVVTFSQKPNATIPALLSKRDPLDYFGERGFSLKYSVGLLKKMRMGVSYQDVSQWSLVKVTDFSLFGKDDDTVARSNPSIRDGKLRSFGTELVFDSRALQKNKTTIDTIPDDEYSSAAVRAEFASPEFVQSDFHFRRYVVSLYTQQRLLGLGTTSMRINWGGSDIALPPQRYFGMTGHALRYGASHNFQTLDSAHFSGSRILSVTLQQDFGHKFFGKCGIPLVKKIPFTVAIHGGAFWTDFAGHIRQAGDDSVRIARHAYSELGFTLGNLTPFLKILNFKLGFTWQLSDYDTNRFVIRWGLRL